MSDRRKYLLLMSAIAIALIGAILLAVPGSPIHQKPTLGLDLQGGLEVVLKAVPPKGHTLTADDMSRSISIMQNRINKLGVSEPEIRKQGNNQIVIQIAGIHDPAAAAKLIGKTAQLMLFDFENDLTGPSKDINGNPVATPSLYELLTQVQTKAAKGTPEAYYLFHTKPVQVKSTKKTTVKKHGKSVTVTKPVTKTVIKHSLVAGPANTEEELLKPYGGKVPPKSQVLKVPAHTIVVSCQTAKGCLGAQAVSPTGSYYYLMNFHPNRTGNTVPEMTGGDLVLSGTPRRLRPGRRADRDTAVHEPRLEPVPEDHARRGAARSDEVRSRREAGRLPQLRPALRDRARRAARVDAVHRLQAQPRRDPRPERRDRPRQRRLDR